MPKVNLDPASVAKRQDGQPSFPLVRQPRSGLACMRDSLCKSLRFLSLALLVHDKHRRLVDTTALGWSGGRLCTVNLRFMAAS